MKKIIILLISVFFINLTFSQERVIKITSPNSNKEITIKENRRIKIKTFDGKKISGKFKILDNENILIKNRRIELTDIQKIKRNPLLISIVTDVFIIYNGVALLGASLVISAFTSESSALLLMIPASGIIYGGIKSPNFLKGYNKNRGWKYKI
ncbi:MAG: hypothetical protein QM486_02020 [Flavobacteriaceae bacterium]